MLITKDLTYTYLASETLAFPDLHLTESKALLLGPSGRGKSTLLHLLTGILPLQSGEIKLGEFSFVDKSPSAIDRFRGSEIGLVFQKPHFFPALTVLENLMVKSVGNSIKVHKKEAISLLEELGIGDQANKNINHLSVGQQQRVSIARALLGKPQFIFADEPTSSLDDENARRVIELLDKITQQHKAQLIVVTHDQRVKNQFNTAIQL